MEPLDNGADPNYKTQDGERPLKNAIDAGLTEIGDLLRAAGAKE